MGALSVHKKGRVQAKQTELYTIEAWTDAFLVYASIYQEKHPSQGREIMKYMSVIRRIASRSSGLGWKSYDEQFRGKRAKSMIPWHHVNWLLMWEYGGGPFSTARG